jgi:hypothetical protein
VFIAAREYPSRSAAIEAALAALLRARMDAHIEAEATQLHPAQEQQLADEGLDDYTTLVGEEHNCICLLNGDTVARPSLCLAEALEAITRALYPDLLP